MNEPTQPGTSLHVKKRSPYFLWFIWVVWLPFATPAFTEIFQSHTPWPRLVASLVGGALFVGIYLWATLRNAQRLLALTEPVEHSPLQAWLTVGILTALSLTLTLNNGSTWGTLFVFTAAYAAGRLPAVQAALALIVIEAIIATGGLHGHFNWSDLVPGIILVAIVGAVVIGVAHSVATDRELRVAREEIARLAVMTERLRIARDLHDLLGHNLSLIALKSELARKLLTVAPERAASEIGDVENVARTTLEEVREAVTNYRQPTLANELHAASEILTAAGIACHYRGDENGSASLPTTLEALLSWTVREGVTNVIRHSHARQCTIHVTRNKQCAGIEIIDDGPDSTARTSETVTPADTGNGGNGLRGLKERVQLLGGQCETGPRATGGFRLAVSVPFGLEQAAHK